jgi:hypothetical protein
MGDPGSRSWRVRKGQFSHTRFISIAHALIKAVRASAFPSTSFAFETALKQLPAVMCNGKMEGERSASIKDFSDPF